MQPRLSHALRLSLPLLAAFASSACAQAPAPLVADYDMEGESSRLADRGPLKLDGEIHGATRVAGHRGQALRFDGSGQSVTIKAPLVDALGANFSVTGWIKIERFPKSGRSWIVAKGDNQGWQWGITDQKTLSIHGYWGGGWYESGGSGVAPGNDWAHFAFTFAKGQRARLYIDGREARSDAAPYAFWKVEDALKLGGGDWAGALDDVRVFATALTPEQVVLDSKNQLPTRAATQADIPPRLYPIRAALARWDAPLPFSEMHLRMKQTAQRIEGPDRVDWPQLDLQTEAGTIPLWRESGEQVLEVPFADEPRNRPLLRQPYDNVVQPSGQWFRALPWIWGQTYAYTSERTARTSSGDFELWSFPLQISQPGTPAQTRPIQSVRLELGGKVIYERTEPLRSLTLLLPQNTGAKYLLRVNGQPPIAFDIGLKPIRIGAPQDELLPLGQSIPNTPLRLSYASTPWTSQQEWDADLKAMADWKPEVEPQVLAGDNWTRRVGLEVPRSPLSIFTVSMPAGMSGGHFFQGDHIQGFRGTPEEYAAFVAAQNFDFVSETIHVDLLRRRAPDYDRWMRAMESNGVRAGVDVTGFSHGGMLGNPNAAFYASTLPEWNLPLQREYQLIAQRFGRQRAFAGITTGADNAGYVPYWDWAPPIPNRPWGRAYTEWRRAQAATSTSSAGVSASAQASPALSGVASVPVGPGPSPQKDYERAGTQREFADYIARYDQTFGAYANFARAVQAIDPKLLFSIGSFGSSPGVGGRGGWPWATVPEREIFAGLPIQTAYDWNELGSSKPMHNVALLDRLESEFPAKTTWSIVDDFGLHFNRATRQRAYALSLSRGLQGLGINFLAHTTAANEPKFSTEPRAQVVAGQREMFAWAKQLGGVWSQARPICEVGILYVHPQAISRTAIGGENETLDKLRRGSHEGKTTEALWMSHAAGFPARIVSESELKRGLAAPLKVLVLTGLNRFDNTWAWSDGLESSLRKFVAGGGTILLDDESVVPQGIPARKTNLSIAAYITQQNTDATPALFRRNANNIAALRQVLAGLNLQRPLVTSDDTQTWAVPFTSGDLQGVVVVNQAMREVPAPPGSEIKEPRLVLAPRKARIAWKTSRPIFDASPGALQVLATDARRASEVDFTTEGARVYLLPPRDLTAPTLEFSPDGDWMSATVTTGVPSMRGVPMRLDISKGGANTSIYTASGRATRLPIRVGESGFFVRATEMLSLKSSQKTVPVLGAFVAPESVARQATLSRLRDWMASGQAPLVIALTPAQSADTAWKNVAQSLRKYLQASGRASSIQTIEPGGLVRGLQPFETIQRFPQWHTADADLILLGSPRDNVLLFDQWRGRLLPEVFEPKLALVRSPFNGGRDALNVLASSAGEARQVLAPLLAQRAKATPRAGGRS